MNETCSSSGGGGGEGDELLVGGSREGVGAVRDEEDPCEGMEFESEEGAKMYYQEYARRVGFVVRLRTCHRDKRGKAIARRMGCNKEGFRDFDRRNPTPKNPRPITRGGCKAMIYVKLIASSGKWTVSKLVKEHNHPLVLISPPPPISPHSTDDEKDRKIQRLTSELQKEERLCQLYREQLTTFLKIIEDQNDHISIKVKTVVDNLKQYESTDQQSHPS